MPPQELSAQQRVIDLLRTLEDARNAWSGRGGWDESPLILMPTDYREGSYIELEERLAQMRESHFRRQWWHVCYRYRFGERRLIKVRITKTREGFTRHLPPRTELIAGTSVKAKAHLVRVYQWSALVDEGQVRDGVATLTSLMYDGDHERIVLPETLLRNRLGLPQKAAA